MIRKAFRMAVHSECRDEYELRHNPIWPELGALLKEHGVLDYSIFLDPADGSLFGYVEIEDEERWAAIAGTELCRKWWAWMSKLMPSNPDNSPVSRDLREVFHFESPGNP